MSKDYKRPERKNGGRGSGSSFLLGILVGLLLGLGIALGAAWYINKMPSPFLHSTPAVKNDTPKAAAPDIPKVEGKTTPAPDGKPRFDFYKILPGSETPTPGQQPKEAQKPTAVAKEAFFLQAGAFQNASDADNLKARLALLGVEASIQTTTIPDKGVWHRVRIGPYTNVEELNKARDTLKQNGVETTLSKVSG
jgi:cell division protein FtsN